MNFFGVHLVNIQIPKVFTLKQFETDTRTIYGTETSPQKSVPYF